MVAAAASAAMLAALLLRAQARRELDPIAALRRPVLSEMVEVATSGGSLAIAICFGAYSCCWFAVVGFLPTLQVERLGFPDLDGRDRHGSRDDRERRRQSRRGWMLQRRVPRVAIIVGATVSMAACAAGIFLDGVPDLARLVLAGVYSAVIGVVRAACSPRSRSMHHGRSSSARQRGC